MAKPKDITKAETPRKETGAETLIRLGSLLHRLAFGGRGEYGIWCPLQQPEAAKVMAEVEQAEDDLIGIAAEDRSLRSALETRRDEVVDRLAIRLIAYVAYHAMAIDPPGVSVTRLTKVAAMDNHADLLKARHLIRSLIIRENALQYHDEDSFCGGSVLPGRALVRYVSGSNGLEVYWDSKSIEAEKARFARLHPGVLSTDQAMAKDSSPMPAREPEAPKPVGVQSPKEIFHALRQTVIGMDPVVRRFSVQMAMHLKRVAIISSGTRPTTPPVVVLLIGPSGAGKTFLAEEFGRLSGLPFCVGSMAEVSATAYVGSSVDELFYGFAKKGTTLADAQKGIMFLDEMDKKRTNQRGGDFDAVGAGVQYELLRILEGSRIQIGGKRSNDVSRGFIETGSMAFILGGAFGSVADALAEKSRRPMGFSDQNSRGGLPPDARELLLDFFIPELVNRIGSVIVVPRPSLEQLVQIATAPTGIVARQNSFLSSFGLQIRPTDEAVNEIAAFCLANRSFARGMRSLLQQLAETAIYEEQQGDLAIGVEDVRRVVEGLRSEPEGLVS